MEFQFLLKPWSATVIQTPTTAGVHQAVSLYFALEIFGSFQKKGSHPK